MELKQEQEYVTHHVQKICAFFLAMREFKEYLIKNNHQVHYIEISNLKATNGLKENLIDISKTYNSTVIEYQQPDEYRLDQELLSLNESYQGNVTPVNSEHFYTEREELENFFKSKKTIVLESFYRYLRKKHHVLTLCDGKPVQGKWNYDKENRASIPKNHHVYPLKSFKNDCKTILADLEQLKIPYIGKPKLKLDYPINYNQTITLLDDFLENGLQYFGRFQDAMTTQSWRVYHSLLSFSMNVKIISPAEVINKSVTYWNDNQDIISIAQIEGFVRQILGWREYMRGIYWSNMPSYALTNYFDNRESLPQFYWNGNTKMNCLKHSINQSLEHGYAHHIQRLMVMGNFALLMGANPSEVDEWYLGIYVDAIEWVQLPNTRGMSQFADGGIVGTKPYVSSANYINKMSNYCSSCSYKSKQTIGDGACPFNSLYWNFINRNRESLEKNRRMSMMYRIWDKKTNQAEILTQARKYINNKDNI